MLDSLDGSSPKPYEALKVVVGTRDPFIGEKPLRETITPTKHLERGPTEANRNLLKEALLKATQPTSINKDSITSTQPSKQQKTESSKNQPSPNGEISHEELQKILE